MSTRTQVLSILSDGTFHSGTDMGQSLGISRAAINKAIQQLINFGLEVHRVSGKGYRMPQACVPLEEEKIRKMLDEASSPIRFKIEVFDELESTSQQLLQQGPDPEFNASVCLAEAQTSGRGRRGRSWLASPYANIMLSISWSFPAGVDGLSGLSLAAGVAVVEALEQTGVQDVGLKWPNDLIWNQKKLGGVLIDLQGEVGGPCYVVLGLGLNVCLLESDARDIETPWTDLRQILGAPPDRNELVAQLINNLGNMFQTFEDEGFAAFRGRWQDLHVFHGQQVKLLHAKNEVRGQVQGVDERGALRLKDSAGQDHLFYSGEISLRPIS